MINRGVLGHGGRWVLQRRTRVEGVIVNAVVALVVVVVAAAVAVVVVAAAAVAVVELAAAAGMQGMPQRAEVASLVEEAAAAFAEAESSLASMSKSALVPSCPSMTTDSRIGEDEAGAVLAAAAVVAAAVAAGRALFHLTTPTDLQSPFPSGHRRRRRLHHSAASHPAPLSNSGDSAASNV